MTPQEHAANLVDKIKYAYFNEEIDEKTSLHIVKQAAWIATHELQKVVLDDKGMPWTVPTYLEEVKREIKRL
jgi:adenylate cyclase